MNEKTNYDVRTSLVAQRLRLHAANVEGPGFNPWSGNQVPHAATKTWHSQLNKFKRKKTTMISQCYMHTYTYILEKALLPGQSHGWRILVGCGPWGCQESDTTERLHFLFSLSCIGEGDGNPLQCSCLENPRDGEACWAAVYGVAQSRTRLK